jgi:hypothetical protein
MVAQTSRKQPSRGQFDYCTRANQKPEETKQKELKVARWLLQGFLILTVTVKWKIGTFNFCNLLFLLGDEITSPPNPTDTSTQTDPTEESKPQACPFL